MGGFFLFILTGLNFQSFAIFCGLLDRKHGGETALHSGKLAVRHHTLFEDMGMMMVPGHPGERGEKSCETRHVWSSLSYRIIHVEMQSCVSCSVLTDAPCLHLNGGCEMMNCWDVLTDASQRDAFDRFFVMINITWSSCLGFCMFVLIHLLFVSLSQQCPVYHNEIQEAGISLN